LLVSGGSFQTFSLGALFCVDGGSRKEENEQQSKEREGLANPKRGFWYSENKENNGSY
jgi:hypothetical protein